MVALELETGWGVPSNTPQSGKHGRIPARFPSPVLTDGNLQRLNSLHALPPISVSEKGDNFLSEARDIIKKQPDASARLKINYITRDKALSILQQYNQLLLQEPENGKKPVKGNKFFKHRGPKLDFVFTEGISSISKTHAPSFLLPKENILQANQPKHIDVKLHKDQLSLTLAPKRRQDGQKLQETQQYKNIKMLGVDTFQSLSIADHMSKKARDSQKDKVKGDLAGFKSPSTYNSAITPRNQPPLKKGNLKSVSGSSSESLDTIKPFPNHKRDKTRKTNLADVRRKLQKGNVKLVSIGDHFEKYSKPLPKRFNPSTFPQFDWRLRMQEQYKKARFEPGREISNGMYSLTNTKKHTNVHALPPIIDFDSNIPKRNRSNPGNNKNVGKRDVNNSDRPTPVFDKKLSHARNSRSVSPNSTCTLSSNLQLHNPPPSFVSSSDEDFNREKVVNEMFPVLEEGTITDNGDKILHENNQRLTSQSINSTEDSKTPKEALGSFVIPKVVIGDGDMPIENSSKVKHDRTRTRSEFKNPSPNRNRIGTPQTERSETKSIPQMSSAFRMLAVPLVSIAKEARPPMPNVLPDKQGGGSEEEQNFPKTSDLIEAIDKHNLFPNEMNRSRLDVGENMAHISVQQPVELNRLSVQNLQILDNFYPSNINADDCNLYRSNVEAFCSSPIPEKAGSNHSDDLGSHYSKQTGVSTKNLVFVSPLAPAANAKRL